MSTLSGKRLEDPDVEVAHGILNCLLSHMPLVFIIALVAAMVSAVNPLANKQKEINQKQAQKAERMFK